MNLPAPSTLLINRYYTKEFFEISKKRLNSNGIFVNHLPFSASMPGKNLIHLNTLVYQTLKSVFPNILVLPEEDNLFFASPEKKLTYEAEILIQRLKERKIETNFFNEDYLNYRLSTDRISTALNLFEENHKTKINTSFFPVSYFYQNLFWLDHFYPRFSKFFEKFSNFFC